MHYNLTVYCGIGQKICKVVTGVKDKKKKKKTTRLKLHKTCHGRVRCVGEQLPYTELSLYAVFTQPLMFDYS